MEILLVAATNFEIQPTINYLAERDCIIGNNHFEVLITGIGSMSTTYWLTKTIAKQTARPDDPGRYRWQFFC